ncbi:MAG TPA: hypothetical protein VGC41_22675, partial [Kofleriaceae bacterium]
MKRVVVIAFLALGCGQDSGGLDAGFTEWSLDDLTPDQGFSLRVPPFDVAAGQEVQNCYFVKVPDINHGGPVTLNAFKSAGNPGSHHLSVFRVKTIVKLDPSAGVPVDLGHGDVSYPATLVEGHADYATNPCWDTANWADWPLVFNSQDSSATNPYFEWKLPTNVAILLQPGEMLMVQSHYVNSTDQATPYGARVGINFLKDVVDPSPTELGTLFATQQHIRICKSNPDVSFSGTCHLPAGSTITAANGHFHKRGVEFDVFTWDGITTQPPPATKFYTSLDWNSPPMTTGLELPVSSGGGVFWTCSYHWTPPQYSTCDEINAKDPEKQNDCCYTFGGNTDIGEHCNVF